MKFPTGHFVYDLGQNMVETVRLHLKGERGLSIKTSLRRNRAMQTAKSTSKISAPLPIMTPSTFSGDENGETFVPPLTSHGFRYVEITGNGCELSDISCVTSFRKSLFFAPHQTQLEASSVPIR